MKKKVLFRFETQKRADSWIQRVSDMFESQIEDIDMVDKSVEFSDAIYYFWDTTRDDGIEFDTEYNEPMFQTALKGMTSSYK